MVSHGFREQVELRKRELVETVAFMGMDVVHWDARRTRGGRWGRSGGGGGWGCSGWFGVVKVFVEGFVEVFVLVLFETS